eukprot:m.256454 g.256454  ORF g.256454 m.256454 type:complete len:97 (+) comp11017_c1_seq14:8410-8700(+)
MKPGGMGKWGGKKIMCSATSGTEDAFASATGNHARKLFTGIVQRRESLVDRFELALLGAIELQKRLDVGLTFNLIKKCVQKLVLKKRFGNKVASSS